MNAERLEDVLDLLAWVFGGLLFGLLVLGAYNGYREYRTPSTPSVDLEPLDKSDVQPEPDRPSFQPLDDFYLVRTLAPEEDEGKPEDPEASPTDTEPSRPSEDVTATDLPYELLGTTTGTPGFTSAVVRHRGRRETRTLMVDDEWEDVRILSIEEDFVLIRNLNNNRRERIPLDERESSG